MRDPPRRFGRGSVYGCHAEEITTPASDNGPMLSQPPLKLPTRWLPRASHVVGVLRERRLVARDLLQNLADLPGEAKGDGAGLAEGSRVPVHLRKHENLPE